MMEGVSGFCGNSEHVGESQCITCTFFPFVPVTEFVAFREGGNIFPQLVAAWLHFHMVCIEGPLSSH